MALETQDDYQDKIDDLMKEVEKLYDEGTDKGFKLKREEEMEQEVRALETEKDYQKKIDSFKDEISYNKQIVKKVEQKMTEEVASIKKKFQKELDNYKVEIELLEEGIANVYKEGTKKGFKLKRSEEMNLEERKQEILASIEARALNTQKAYQKEIDKYNEKLKELQDDMDKFYSDAAIKKHLKSYLASMENKFLSQEENGKRECLREIEKCKKIIDQFYKEAKGKGFDVKK